jgi:UTP--glucose-1-phosphate uridylyltransferase
MEIKKTVITAAGQNQRTLPLQTVVDGNGQTKSALAIIVEESLQAGIEEICVVISPGDQDAYRAAAGPHGRSLKFIEQTRPLGYGHAVWCAREFTGSSPFLLLVGDHLYLSRSAKRCAQQLVETAAAEACTVSAVQATHESKLPYYGTVGGRLAGARKGLYVVSDVAEKPTPTEAEQKLIVPGLRAGYYLCFFGMHVLTPRVMALLEAEVAAAGEKGRVHLSAALSRLTEHERYLACELDGRRFDIGVQYGLLTAQLALALNGKDRDEVLSGLVELLALGGK